MSRIHYSVAILLFSTQVFSATQPVYQVVVRVKANGIDSGSSSLIVEEGQKGEIKNILGNGEGHTLEVQVSPSTSGRVSLDYRIKDQRGGKLVEIAKSSPDYKLGSFEKAELKDGNGSDFQAEIVVKTK